ncbi:ABC transporter permease [Aquimarina brevivitae]|uniref:Putative ABC transport system permease protein n=1 Tax=Aquimarina brevivitae TaxID=323412 RepID=A0A4Q7PFI6_9FLAO|nr:ABC transporter permease [Aquimarina brevivitae]RZS98947.1 putative ABC transport system permease protein [Aquimarina brevivitae]
MLIYLRVLKESFAFAVNALRNNKLRTFLSLLGVTIGIFSIIGVLAAVDSLEKEIKGSLSSLDNSTIYLTRRSFGPTQVPRWKREQFPDVTYDEFQNINKSLNGVEAMSFILFVGPESVKGGENTVSNVNVNPVTDDYYDVEELQVVKGRFFNEQESVAGTPVIVIGDEIANSLYGQQDPIGQRLRLYGQKFTVIGVLKKEGSGLFGDSKDTAVFIPVNMARRIFGDNNKASLPGIIIKPVDDVDNAKFIAELKQKFRTLRGLKPDEVDNFFVNQLQGFTDAIDSIASTMSAIGAAIGAFSLLVGGFGIANIMFVSVKERTNLIGIQKALGAKKKFILLQFLFEAIILAVIGGLIGLLFVWLISKGASQLTGDFEFILSSSNMFWGMFFSTIIGLIAGIIPAWMASKLDPVEAIRTGM